MGFQSLTRKELQTLCKKNKIPANMTNVAMADALAALQEVAGIEETLNPMESESQKSEQRILNGSPGNSDTACRTSTRRKPVKEEPPTTQSIIRTRRGRVGEMADQVNKDLNVPPTPSIPSSRRRALVTSAQEKSTVQGVCSTRRSMRLLEKNMEKLSLKELGSLEPVVAYNLCDELPEGKGLGEQKINESDPEEMTDSKPDAQKKIGSDALEEEESDDAEGKNDNKDKKKEEMNNNGKECDEADESKEKAEMSIYESDVKENKDGDDNINDKEHQSKAAIEDQNKVLTREKHNENSVDLVHNMGITMQNEAMEENSAIFVGEEEGSINEEMGEFNVEDLVEITVMEAEFLEASNQKTCKKQLASARNSISKPEMENGSKNKILVEFQVLQDGDHFVDDALSVREPELVENFNSMDSISEPKMKDLSTSESLVEIQVFQDEDNSGMTKNISMDSISEPKMKDLSRSESLVEIGVSQNEVNSWMTKNISMDSISEPKMKDLSRSESLVEIGVSQDEVSSWMTNISREVSFRPFAVDELPGKFPLPIAEVSVEESRTCLKMCNAGDEEDDTKNYLSDELPGKFPLPKAEVSVEESRTCLKMCNAEDEEDDTKNYLSDEEKKMSLRQLRKMIKELKIPKKSNKEKTNGKKQVENAVRTALQPPPENCMAKDGQEKTTITTGANSQFI